MSPGRRLERLGCWAHIGMTQQEQSGGLNWRLTAELGKVCKKKGDGSKQGKRSSLAPHITPACGETVPQELDPPVTRHRQLMVTPIGGSQCLLCSPASGANQRPLRPGLWLTTASLPEKQARSDSASDQARALDFPPVGWLLLL